MKFLVDAQLPVRLARLLTAAGHPSIHTSNLATGNRTPDAAVAARADLDDRVVVTKDRDFRDSHFLRQTPRRLLIVTIGNTTNNELLDIFKRHVEAITAALGESNLVELTSHRLIIHADRPDAGR